MLDYRSLVLQFSSERKVEIQKILDSNTDWHAHPFQHSSSSQRGGVLTYYPIVSLSRWESSLVLNLLGKECRTGASVIHSIQHANHLDTRGRSLPNPQPGRLGDWSAFSALSMVRTDLGHVILAPLWLWRLYAPHRLHTP